jgi:chromosome segregation protein
MNIKKLELQGFKSFPEKTKIVFHPGITAIIGPNGTGKSNIVDALMWVLGGKRIKSFRGERGTEIIFNGSQKRAPMSMADVTLLLEDAVEQLKINHRYFRSGESEYRLDGKLVRLKDIQESLWQKSIGEKEYYVIEQGSIGLFLSSKPLEKRVLLEEAAGTAYYKDKKRQAQNKLENSEQNLTRLEDIVAEVSKAKISLKRQANAAIRYRKLRERIRQLTSFHFRKKIQDMEKQLEETLSHYRQSLDRENQMSLKLKEEESHLSVKRKEFWALEKAIKESNDNLYTLKAQIAKAESDVDKETKRIDFFADKTEGAEKDKEELVKELETLDRSENDTKAQVEKFKETQIQTQADLQEIEKKNQSIKNDLEAGQKKTENLRSTHFQYLSEYTPLKNERAKIEKELELLLRQKEKLQSQLEEETSHHLQKKEAFKKKDQEFTRTQDLLHEKRTGLKKLQREAEECQASLQQIQERAAELFSKKDEIQHQFHALEKLEEAERASVPPLGTEGALGILADLIEADESEVTLIDLFWKEESKAALFEANKFVDTLSNKGLKGNYLLLHPQEKKIPSPELDSDPRVLGRLKSHVRAHKNIKDRLSHLQDAAVVKDIKSAVELWLDHPSLNFVTTSGDVLFSSGFLKAGDKREGLFTLRREKERLHKKIESLESGLQTSNGKKEEKLRVKSYLEKKITDELDQIQGMEKKITDAEKKLLVEEAEIEKISASITIIKKESGILNEDINRLQKNLEILEAKIKKTEQEEEDRKELITRMETAVSTLQQAWEQGRKQFFELKSNIDVLNEKINSLNRQLQTMGQRRETVQIKLDSLDAEIQNSEKENENIEENIRRFSQEIRKLKKALKEKEELLMHDESNLKQMQDEQNEIEEKVGREKKEAEARKDERIKWEIKKAERERDLVNLEESCWQELRKSIQEVKQDISIEDIREGDLETSLEEAREQLQSYKAVNLMAEEEYEIHRKRYDFLIKEREDLHASIASTKEAIKKIDQESKSQFLQAVTEVNKNFQEVFSQLFEGGHAEIKLTDPGDVLESGVDIIAQPPGKRVQSLNLLSGGERALTSLAFFFALFRYKPTPFCLLDEVDAALDEVNLGRFLKLMKKVKERTQFILITHNFKTMEVADYIYGTTMAEPNITSLYSMKIDKKETL